MGSVPSVRPVTPAISRKRRAYGRRKERPSLKSPDGPNGKTPARNRRGTLALSSRVSSLRSKHRARLRLPPDGETSSRTTTWNRNPATGSSRRLHQPLPSQPSIHPLLLRSRRVHRQRSSAAALKLSTLRRHPEGPRIDQRAEEPALSRMAKGSPGTHSNFAQRSLAPPEKRLRSG